jgi:uncharacterized RDD family membrane protein YckC
MEMEERQYAGFWLRVAASLLDFIVLLVFVGLNFMNTYSWKSLPLMLVINGLTIAYKPFMEWRYGATVGKMTLNLMVITVDYKLMSLAQSLIRSLPWLLSGAVTIYAAIALMTHPDYPTLAGFKEIAALQSAIVPMSLNMVVSVFLLASVIVVAFDSKKRGLHDMLAKTYCVKVTEEETAEEI